MNKIKTLNDKAIQAKSIALQFYLMRNEDEQFMRAYNQAYKDYIEVIQELFIEEANTYNK